jgi:hypothetical protein
MDIMVDLETLSSAPDAAIVAIGAVTFNDGSIPAKDFVRQTFSVVIDARSSQRLGGRIDGETVSWWLRQPELARMALLTEPKMTASAILDFCGWVKAQSGAPRIWGNGANFDNVVLRQTFERAHINAPWEFRADRCYRTLKALRPDIPFEPYGTHHNALDDAFAQAVHAERILAAIKGA